MPDLSPQEADLQNGEISMMRVTSQTGKIQSCLSEKKHRSYVGKIKRKICLMSDAYRKSAIRGITLFCNLKRFIRLFFCFFFGLFG